MNTTSKTKKTASTSLRLVQLAGLLLLPFAIYSCLQNDLTTFSYLLYGLLITDITAIAWVN